MEMEAIAEGNNSQVGMGLGEAGHEAVAKGTSGSGEDALLPDIGLKGRASLFNVIREPRDANGIIIGTTGDVDANGELTAETTNVLSTRADDFTVASSRHHHLSGFVGLGGGEEGLKGLDSGGDPGLLSSHNDTLGLEEHGEALLAINELAEGLESRAACADGRVLGGSEGN
jgi:hypothetical protein